MSVCSNVMFAGRMTLVSCWYHTCSLSTVGGVTCWGRYLDAVPASATSNQVAIASGASHACTLSASGGVMCWGNNNNGQSFVPRRATSDQFAITAGYWHTCSLSASGGATCWGRNDAGQCVVPASAASNQVAIAGGELHTCSLSASGGATCWGHNFYDQTSVPAGATSIQVIIAGGFYHTCTLSASGGVTCWGAGLTDTGYWPHVGQCAVPAIATSNQVAIATGERHSCSLSAFGGATCWGGNDYGQCDVPAFATSYQVAIAAGSSHTCTLSASGGATCWGAGLTDDNGAPPSYANFGQSFVPASSLSGIALPCRPASLIVATPSQTPSNTPSSSVTPSSSQMATLTPSNSPTPSKPSNSPTPSGTPSSSQSTTPTLSNSPTPSETPSSGQTMTQTASSSKTVSYSATLTPGLACPPSLFRALPRTDLVGTPLTNAPLAVSSENACRIACCGAPGCDGYAFAFTELRFGDASCFLFANISATFPSSVMRSGIISGIQMPPPFGAVTSPSPPVPPSSFVSAPCQLRLFPTFDIIGSVLSSSVQPDETACSSMCCSLNQCKGYSFFSGITGVSVASSTGIVSVLSDRTYYNGGQCGPGFIDVNGGRNCPLNMIGVQLGSSGSVVVPSRAFTGIPCILLSNISELIPSNVMNGGIKQSALSGSSS